MNNMEITPVMVALITAIGGVLGKLIDIGVTKVGLKKAGKAKGRYPSLPWIMGGTIGLLMGLGLGSTGGAPHPPPPLEKVLWDFEKSSQGWEYKKDTQEAATDAFWNGTEQALQVEFDFNIDPQSFEKGEEPRATFIIDNQHNMEWTEYNLLLLDIQNKKIDLLEITFSVNVNNCFYEYGNYVNIPAQEGWQTITFALRDSAFKTCNSSEVPTNAPPSYNPVNRFDIIIGTNAAAKDWKHIQGEILVDNIRLQK